MAVQLEKSYAFSEKRLLILQVQATYRRTMHSLIFSRAEFKDYKP